MMGWPLQLPARDKLDVLRQFDEFHYWRSLDDERRCKRCSRIITGNQIQVFENDGAWPKLRLQCPTLACQSTPSDWVYADPFIAARFGAQPGPITRRAEADDNPPVRSVPSEHRSHSFPGAFARQFLLRPFATRLAAFSRR